MKQKIINIFDKISDKVALWIGSTGSIIIHTLLFIGVFVLYFLGIKLDILLLLLTTAVSLEAIYLSIFIQRSVNKQRETLEDVEESLEDVEESFDKLEEEDKADDLFDTKIEKQLEYILAEVKRKHNHDLTRQRK